MPDVSSSDSTPSSTPVMSPTMSGDNTTRAVPTAGPRARALGRSLTDSPALSAAASRKHLERVQGTLYRETQPSSGGSPVWRPRSASVSWDKEGPSLPANYHKTSDVEIAVNTPPQSKNRSSLLGWSSPSSSSPAPASKPVLADKPASLAVVDPVAAEKPTPVPAAPTAAAPDASSSSSAASSSPTSAPDATAPPAPPAVQAPPVPPLNLGQTNPAPVPVPSSVVPPSVMHAAPHPGNGPSPPPEAVPYAGGAGAPGVAPMYYPVPPHMQVDFQQFFESLNPQQQAQYMQQQAMYMASVNHGYNPAAPKQEDAGAQNLTHAMGNMSMDGPGAFGLSNPPQMNHYPMTPQASPFGPPHGMWQQPQGLYVSPPQSPMAPPHEGQHPRYPRSMNGPALSQQGPGSHPHNSHNSHSHHNSHHNSHSHGNGNNPRRGGSRGGKGHQQHGASSATNSMVPMDVAPPHVTVDNMVCWEVRFKAGRTDVYCTTTDAPGKLVGMDYVMVEADRGKDMGVLVEQVPCDNYVNDPDILKRRILRRAQHAEVSQVATKAMEEGEALEACRAKVAEHKLPMEVAEAEYQFDRRKLTFYFTAEGRIDFRILVRDLFKLFKTRIWLKQLPSPEAAPKSATTPPTSSPAETPKKSATPPPVAH